MLEKRMERVWWTVCPVSFRYPDDDRHLDCLPNRDFESNRVMMTRVNEGAHTPGL